METASNRSRSNTQCGGGGADTCSCGASGSGRNAPCKKCERCDPGTCKATTVGQRISRLSRPNTRRLKDLWNEKCGVLDPKKRDNIKKSLEDDYFLTPEQTEMYFAQVNAAKEANVRRLISREERREREKREKEMRLRQKWLSCFSAQVAHRVVESISKGPKDLIVSNRLRSIADVVLERVAEILGEPKPSRKNGSRLARFMVTISDRVAVWIENSVYHAEEYVKLKEKVDEIKREKEAIKKGEQISEVDLGCQSTVAQSSPSVTFKS